MNLHQEMHLSDTNGIAVNSHYVASEEITTAVTMKNNNIIRFVESFLIKTELNFVFVIIESRKITKGFASTFCSIYKS